MDWQEKFRREFLMKPGEHLLNLGITGSGKTQDLLWLLEGLRYNSSKETIIWNDSGKSSELLLVAQMAPINLIIPSINGHKLDVDFKTDNNLDVTKTWFEDPRDVWTVCLDKNRVNVLVVEPFIRRPVMFTRWIAEIFSQLIEMSHDYKVPAPLAIFYDEFHLVAPGKGHAFNKEHASFGSEIQYNIERLRSLKIRFIASTHQWTKIRKGVRSSFNWFMMNRGALFSSDEQPRLSRFNRKFENLNTDEAMIAFPTKVFTDVMKMPYYGNGEDYGRIIYRGKIKPVKSEREAKVKQHESEVEAVV